MITLTGYGSSDRQSLQAEADALGGQADQKGNFSTRLLQIVR
jgi:hypothetical protein